MKHKSANLLALITLLLFHGIVIADEEPRDIPDHVKVDVQGTMGQVMAIGGETTGIVISANGISWELDLGNDRDLCKTASNLFDSKVRITGSLSVKRGVEIPRRWIVKVDSLAAATKNQPYFVDGKLTQSLVLKDAQGGFAGFSGRIWSIQPDGSWTRAEFLNERVREADQKGKLSAQQLKQLAKTLADHDVKSLPNQLGKIVGANPRIYTFSFGRKESSFSLQTSGELPTSKNPETPEEKFSAIANEILKLATPAKK